MAQPTAQLSDPSYLLGELDRIIAGVQQGDGDKKAFFTALKRFISLDQDNPFVHRFLYEFERNLIQFAQLDFTANIDVDTFEDDEGKNLFHHIGINVNMLFEEVKERVYPKEHVFEILDIIDQPGVIITTQGFIEHNNESFTNLIGRNGQAIRHERLDSYIRNLGSCMYKAALISEELFLDDIIIALPTGEDKIVSGRIRALGNEYDKQMNFAIILESHK